MRHVVFAVLLGSQFSVAAYAGGDAGTPITQTISQTTISAIGQIEVDPCATEPTASSWPCVLPRQQSAIRRESQEIRRIIEETGEQVGRAAQASAQAAVAAEEAMAPRAALIPDVSSTTVEPIVTVVPAAGAQVVVEQQPAQVVLIPPGDAGVRIIPADEVVLRRTVADQEEDTVSSDAAE